MAVKAMKNKTSTFKGINLNPLFSFLGLDKHGPKDFWFVLFMKSVAIFTIASLTLFIVLMVLHSFPAIEEFGLNFITSKKWNPVQDRFGALAFIYGTSLTSFLAVLIAAPLSVGVALFINEICSDKWGKFLSIFVEMIAAIPSIVFGLWALFYLAPFVKDSLAPFLKTYLGFLPIFKGPSFGIGILTASLILAVMIIPTIASISREVFRSVPTIQKEAALALGATRAEMMYMAIFKPSFSGVMGAIVLGLGRALGETMAVAMVIGNSAKISASLFSPGATMASIIANEYAEADSDLHLASMIYIGLILFMITLIVNALSRIIVWNFNRKKGMKK